MGIFNVHLLFLLFFFFFFVTVIATTSYAEIAPPPPSPPPPAPNRSRDSPFRPSIAIVIAILTTILSITFLLLLYAKHCKKGPFGTMATASGISSGNTLHSSSFRKNSGIDRKVIESLPIFRFGSLRGQKAVEGLECAVCLNKFEPSEILRLLPKCKHAFHVECVDTWLDAHSTCPLCRYQVHPEDILLISHTTSERKSTSSVSSSPIKEKSASSTCIRHSSAGERGTCSSSSLQIIVETPRQQERPSFLNRRMSLDSWNFHRKKSKSTNTCSISSLARKDGMLLLNNNHKDPGERRLEHRIIISGDHEPPPPLASTLPQGTAAQYRWSDVEACDMLYLRSEMILSDSRRYSGSRKRRDEIEGGEGSGRRVINERSVSEMTGMSRFRSNEERERERKGAVKRWLDWISQSQNKSVSVSAVAASSSTSATS
ncbi:putative iron-sulfur cluster assembly protein 1-like [Capsicum annuum]|nr:putative iron-sulfur cluster assembly protein 1-like [Capsicum annuum]